MTPQPPTDENRGPGGTDPALTVGEPDLAHESIELPTWVPVGFGLLLIMIAAAAIWTA